MKQGLPFVALASGLLLLAGAALAQPPAPPELALDQWLAYDQQLPLDASRTLIAEEGDLTSWRVEFSTAHNKRVPALLIEPKGALGPLPVLVFMHGHGGQKEDLLPLAPALAPFGYALLAFDAEYHGERQREGFNVYSTNVYASRDALIQTVIDARRCLDWLDSQPEEFDPARTGLLGGSMGGILGAVVAGVDKRVEAAALVSAGADWTEMLRLNNSGASLEVKQAGVEPEVFGAALRPVDPLYWVMKISPRPVLMLNGNQDTIVAVPTCQLLHDLAEEPKRVVWYDSGHSLPLPQAFAEIVAWFGAWLKPASEAPPEG